MLAAQVTHAAGESSPGHLPEGTHAVVLAAKSEAEILDVERRLALAGIPHVSVRETDALYVGQLMAIGLAPAPKPKIRKHLSSLPLLGRKGAT